jgi:CBS domain-containing protein
LGEGEEIKMLVSQILKNKGDNVFTIGPNETIGSASTLLHRGRVGALVVQDEAEAVVGIISERDVVRAVAEAGAAALLQPVSRSMSAEVIFAEPTESIDELLARMTDRRVRHLPVCRDHRLVGIVSIGDLVKVKIAEAEHEAETLKNYIAAG